MPLVGFQPTISASAWPLTYTLHRTATVIKKYSNFMKIRPRSVKFFHAEVGNEANIRFLQFCDRA
jgi:hypothetical protein